ncbi:MAG: bifunctional folylpolyglutamate synthase/dihydrofolate synthase [Firmicutes bacterium]|nr:bifunctional folylpolyglutamate synthase/dihydrofolate synthase [Bacillota bacterium]
MTYDEAVKFIEAMGANVIKLGLERVEELLHAMGDPQENLNVIHVAGTNGKGSFCAFMSSILRDAGYRVGVYTSPHLVSYTERYSINGENISEKEFSDIVEYIKESAGDIDPTPFEMLTALAFEFFKRNNTDFVILEVGLGGRFDATNVIKKPILSAIAQIGMDHMDYLGDTVEKIAFEKGGIIKENSPAVLYFQENDVYDVIKGICDEKNAKLYYPEYQDIEVVSQNFRETVFNLKTDLYEYKSLAIRLIGNYQMENAANAVCAAYVLQQSGIPVSEENIRNGLKNAKWEGRMELFDIKPMVLLEGAHNIDGIRELRSSLETYFKDIPITLLLGVLGDKEYEKMLQEIVPLCDRIVLTKPENTRALDISILKERTEKIKPVEFVSENINEAFEYGFTHTEENGVLCCAGSLYLVGAIKKHVLNGNNIEKLVKMREKMGI